MHLPLKKVNVSVHSEPEKSSEGKDVPTNFKGAEGLPSICKRWVERLWQPSVQSILIITFLLLASRALGFIRQVLIYQKMSPIASDLLLSSAKIPEMIATFLIMGTVISSVLPVASRIETKSKSLDELSKYLNLILATLLGGIFLLILVLFILTPQFLRLITSDEILNYYQEAGIFEDYVGVSRILLLGPLLFTLQAVLGVFLTMKKKFFVYGLAGLIYNLGAVIALAISGNDDYFTTAWGMTLGAAAASLLFWVTAGMNGFKVRYLFSPLRLGEAFRFHRQDFWQTWKLFSPRVFLVNGSVLANLVIIYIAQNKGQITSVDIALSIQAVFLVLVGAVGTVFFPDLAKVWNGSKWDTKPFWRKLFSYTEKTALISLAGAVITFVAIPLVMWLFELFGKGQDSAEYIVYLARIATLGLIFQAVNEILSKYFFVRERIWQPVIISVSGTICQVLLVLGLWQLGLDAGVVVSLSLVINSLVILLVSWFIIRRDYKSDMWQSRRSSESKPDRKRLPGSMQANESGQRLSPFSG